MKLTIDTKHDSHAEIKHAIQILTHLLERQGVSTATKTNESVDTTNMMNMFGDNDSSSSTPTSSSSSEPVTPMSMFTNTEPVKEVPDTAPDFTSLLNLANKKEEDKEEQKVEYF